MKYQESYLGSKAEFGDFIKKAVPELFAGKLVVEGKTVGLPTEADLDYKVKFDEDEEGGSITFKVSWEKASNVELTLDD
jgi:amphi-Trp domain-containing protein